MDLNILGEIMRGGAEKVIEAGGTLAGGHSIADSDIKYGLSVTGLVNQIKSIPIMAQSLAMPSSLLSVLVLALSVQLTELARPLLRQ